MAKEWTDDEVQSEIREAVRIVHEDRERATYTSLHEKYGKQPEPDGKQDPGEGDPPPKKDKTEDPPQPPKRSLWWG